MIDNMIDDQKKRKMIRVQVLLEKSQIEYLDQKANEIGDLDRSKLLRGIINDYREKNPSMRKGKKP